MHGSSCYPCAGAAGPPSSPTQPHRHHQPPCLSFRSTLLRLVLLLACAWAHVPGVASGRQRLLSNTGVDDGMAQLRAAYSNHSWEVPVLASHVPHIPAALTKQSGRRRSAYLDYFVNATGDEQMMPLYNENLEADLAPWRRRGRAAVSLSALVAWSARLPFRPTLRLVVLRGGRLGVAGQDGRLAPECRAPCDPLMQRVLADLRRWVEADPSAWPDAAFLLNVGSTSLCHQPQAQQLQLQPQHGRSQGSHRLRQGGRGRGSHGGAPSSGRRSLGPCPAPVFSLVKEWSKHRDEDILVPRPADSSDVDEPLLHFPYEQKVTAAFFRGDAPQECHVRPWGYAPGLCAPAYIAHMSQADPEWARWVDAGLTHAYGGLQLPNGTSVGVQPRGDVPLAEWARFRFTLALDGATAPPRLARLLSINSPVLKQASPWIEWYYRSLVPGTHYIPFWLHDPSDLIKIMSKLYKKAPYLQETALVGQAFAYRYLTPHARMLYWRRVLHEYVSVVGDMDTFLQHREMPPS